MGNPSFALAFCHVLPLAQTEERFVECKFYAVVFKKSVCCKRECITDAYSFASICTRADRKVRFPYLLKINSNIYFQNQIHNMKA
jgi:hypothetical protein